MALKSLLKKLAITAVVPAALAASQVNATNLTVTHWATGMYGTPFAVAMDKGFFKEAGIDVTGFIASKGGGTTVRNAMAADIPYGEVALPAAIAAIKQGLPLTIVHGGVVSMADIIFVALKDSPLNGIDDLKGTTLGYSSPKSVTDMASTLALTNKNLMNDVERKSVGGVSSGLTALREGGVDSIYMIEPSFSANKQDLKVVFRSDDEIPNMTQTVGVVRTDYLKENPDIIKAIIEGRRKGVDYLVANPDESAKILAKHYKLDESITKTAIDNILAAPGTYWSAGQLDYDGMNEMLKGLVLVNAVEDGPFDWAAITDETLLPEDLRSK